MDIVIVEDEKLTAADLEEVILEVDPTSRIIAKLYSVKQALEYFKKNPDPDLIFSDIQLGDGLSIDVFTELGTNTPIVFCTAYDQYMLNAFRLNGIDYLLKPFTRESVKAALDKFKGLSQVFGGGGDTMEELKDILKGMKMAKVASVLVYHKEKIIPIKVEDIAVFYIKNQATFLMTFDGKNYYLDKTLSDVEEMCGDEFFRANRQILINRKSVKNASHHLSRKFSVSLNVPFDEIITVSREKLNDFLEWLAG